MPLKANWKQSNGYEMDGISLRVSLLSKHPLRNNNNKKITIKPLYLAKTHFPNCGQLCRVVDIHLVHCANTPNSLYIYSIRQ